MKFAFLSPLIVVQFQFTASFIIKHPQTAINTIKQQYHGHSIPSSTTILTSSPSDNTNDETTNPYEYYRPQSRSPPIGGDMAYTEDNIRRSATTFQSIRKIGGATCTDDIYVSSNKSPFQYWYIGKIARTDGTVSLEQGIARIWNLIEEHACRLRAVELGREYGTIQVWCSKCGDTELLLSQATTTNDNGDDDDNVSLMKMEQQVTGSKNVSVSEVGFMAEVVTNQGQGFYIIRDDQGKLMQ